MRILGIFTFVIICSCTSNEGQQSISKPNKLSGEGTEIVKISETQSEGELNVQDVSGQFSDYLRLSIKYRNAFIVILKNISERNLSISVDTNFFSGEIVVQNGSKTCLLEDKVIHKARLFGPGEWLMPPPRILKPEEEIKWTLLTRDLWSVSLEEEECDLFSPPDKEVFARLSRVAILNTAGEYTRPRGDYGSNKIDFLEGGKYYRIAPPHSVVVSVPKVNPDDYSDRDIKKLIDKLASKNKDPNPDQEPLSLDWGGYRKKNQIIVETAEAELEAIGIKAFPLLIASASDSRYSQSNLTSIIRSDTVGDICLDIIARQITKISGIRHGTRSRPAPNYKREVLLKDPQKWWESHSHMTLKEIKLEVAKWTLEAEEGSALY